MANPKLTKISLQQGDGNYTDYDIADAASAKAIDDIVDGTTPVGAALSANDATTAAIAETLVPGATMDGKEVATLDSNGYVSKALLAKGLEDNAEMNNYKILSIETLFNSRQLPLPNKDLNEIRTAGIYYFYGEMTKDLTNFPNIDGKVQSFRLIVEVDGGGTNFWIKQTVIPFKTANADNRIVCTRIFNSIKWYDWEYTATTNGRVKNANSLEVTTKRVENGFKLSEFTDIGQWNLENVYDNIVDFPISNPTEYYVMLENIPYIYSNDKLFIKQVVTIGFGAGSQTRQFMRGSYNNNFSNWVELATAGTKTLQTYNAGITKEV